MSDLSQLPVWTPFWVDEMGTYVYEALDGQGRAWRMWRVTDPPPDDPFPAGYRFAPLDALDQINFIEKVGGAREFDQAAILIDAGQTVTDAAFQRRMGWNEPAVGQDQIEHAIAETLTRYSMDAETTGALVGLVIEGRDEQAITDTAAQHGYRLDGNDFFRFVGTILGHNN